MSSTRASISTNHLILILFLFRVMSVEARINTISPAEINISYFEKHYNSNINHKHYIENNLRIANNVPNPI